MLNYFQKKSLSSIKKITKKQVYFQIPFVKLEVFTEIVKHSDPGSVKLKNYNKFHSNFLVRVVLIFIIGSIFEGLVQDFFNNDIKAYLCEVINLYCTK